MKIIHIITDLDTGGAEQVLYNLLRGGLGEHCENYVISLRDEGPVSEKIRELGIYVIHLGVKFYPFSIFALKRFYSLMRKINPDVIQGWMYHGNLAATYGWKRMDKTPTLIWNIRHSLDGFAGMGLKTRGIVRLGRVFSRSPRKIIYNSRVSRERHEVYGFATRKGLIIPNGIDVDRFHFETGIRRKMRAALGIQSHTLVVGHVARFHTMKDHATFLKAAVLLLESGEDVFFLMAGKKVTSENKEIAQFIPDRWKDRFRLLGEQTDILSLMNAMDVFCLSSWTEAFPNVLGEAMACEVPCVTTNVGDAADIVADTGIVVPPKNPEALADGLKKMIKMTLSERRALGKAARQRIIEKFSLERMVREYEKVYEGVIGR